MARRRKITIQERWNRILARAGLSVNAGRDPRLVYVEDIEFVEGAERMADGKVKTDDNDPE